MRNLHRWVGQTGLVLSLIMLTGCVSGEIYSHTTRPLDVDFNNTPVHDGRRGESWKTLVIPIYYQDAFLRFDWGDMSIANSMEEAGIETVHYADVETRSVMGIWTESWVHVYGE